MAKENPLASNLTLEQQKNLFGNAYLNMLWHCPTDQRFPYWVHLPDCYYDEKDPHYKLLVIIHGTGCAVEDYVRHAKELADRDHVAVLAPLFPGGLIQRDLAHLAADADLRDIEVGVSQFGVLHCKNLLMIDGFPHTTFRLPCLLSAQKSGSCPHVPAAAGALFSQCPRHNRSGCRWCPPPGGRG